MSALTDLLTSESTARGLRVRDEYVRSSQVAVLVAVYFMADVLLRGLVILVLGYALGPHLGTSALGLVGKYRYLLTYLVLGYALGPHLGTSALGLVGKYRY